MTICTVINTKKVEVLCNSIKVIDASIMCGLNNRVEDTCDASLHSISHIE